MDRPERYSVNLIVACSENGVIGLRGAMPWSLLNEASHFARTTKGGTVIIGRKTFESIGSALPGRRNIVLTRNEAYDAPGCVVLGSLEDAIDVAHASRKYQPIWIIGGGEIYKYALERDLVDNIVRTTVHASVEGDTVFPELSEHIWTHIEGHFIPACLSYEDLSITIDYFAKRHIKEVENGNNEG